MAPYRKSKISTIKIFWLILIYWQIIDFLCLPGNLNNLLVSGAFLSQNHGIFTCLVEKNKFDFLANFAKKNRSNEIQILHYSPDSCQDLPSRITKGVLPPESKAWLLKKKDCDCCDPFLWDVNSNVCTMKQIAAKKTSLSINRMHICTLSLSSDSTEKEITNADNVKIVWQNLSFVPNTSGLHSKS